MFEKLLALVPYNPGIVHQLAFYSRRMREEAAIRRTGVIFLVLAFMIQFFAVLSPPQSTVADSPNDLINGGCILNSPDASKDCKKLCMRDTQGYMKIMHYYGISCAAFDSAEELTIHANGQNYKSLGRQVSDAKDTPANIEGGGKTLYWRDLSAAWGSDKSYTAYRLRDQNGKVFYVIRDCANLVSVGYPPRNQLTTPEDPEPTGGSTTIPLCPFNHNLPASDPGCYCPFNQSIPPGDPNCYCPFNQNISTGDPSCYCPFNHSIPPGDAGCYCPTNNNVPASDASCFCPFNNKVPPTDPTCFCPFNNKVPPTDASCYCPFNNNVPPGDASCYCPFDQSIPPTDAGCYCPVPGKTTLPKDSPDCFEGCEFNPEIPKNDERCKPCDESVSSADSLACIEFHKSASNITLGSTDANNTTVKAGDVITYTLYAKNKGKASVKNFVFQENIADVLDYADVTDLHGGTMTSDKFVAWPAQEIKAGEQVTQKITVKVKDPIPATPVSSSDPMHFDLTMTNIYGDSISIKLPGAVTKQVEIVAAKLPNTGPGETLAAIAVIVIIGGYSYGRARLLARESDIAVKETAK